MKRKIKRYDEGGDVVDLRDDASQSTGINDDVRARARRFLETGKKDEESEPVRAKSKPKMIKAKEESKEPKNFRVPDAEPGLERVTPELDLLPIGKVAGAVGAGYMGARALGKHILGKRAASEAAEAAEKATEMSAKKSSAIKEGLKNKSDRIMSSGAMEGDFKVGQMRQGYKKGGMVASRGDGCAQRGKTKGRLL